MRSGLSGPCTGKAASNQTLQLQYLLRYLYQGRIMGIVRRQLGDRRMGLPLGFPLVDGDDVLVSRDRRIQQERRVAGFTLEEIEMLLSQLLHKGASSG